MLSSFYPRIYQWWRPKGVRLLMGVSGPSKEQERAMARRMLDLRSGHTVLDVACGPGNFTGWFGEIVGADGLAIGIDSSPTMLEQAVRDNASGPVAYLRGDAEVLPFRDGAFDAVCCFAALFLMSDPYRAIEEAVRVVAPGGRIAILTSCASRWPMLRGMEHLIAAGAGLTIFGPDDITGALTRHGCADVEQRTSGVVQFVGARRP